MKNQINSFFKVTRINNQPKYILSDIAQVLFNNKLIKSKPYLAATTVDGAINSSEDTATMAFTDPKSGKRFRLTLEAL
jgi:hypothetical protein